MKRGKDDEKMMGPLFPRLHVNDTEKGGPRAPPRNKMALYEQLSVPSQRFHNPGALPLNSSKTNNLVPASSSSQGSGYERNWHFRLHVPPAPSHLAENLHSRQPDGGRSNATSVQIEQKKKVGDEDDFRVPVFVQSGMGQCLGKTQCSIDRESPTTITQDDLGHSKKLQNVGDNDQKNESSGGSNLRQDTRNQSDEDLEVCTSSRNHSIRSFTSFPSKDKIVRADDASPNQENPDQTVASFSSLCENDVRLQQQASVFLQRYNSGVPDLTREMEKDNVPQLVSDSHSREGPNSLNDPEIDSEHYVDKASVQFGNGDKSDAFSETSMVDSISALDISPDDVVGIIGQKHFWKARKAIVNQQRLFAVQVFELHRLIKVQRLIAASPHLLLEESTYLGKPSVKVSPMKKISSEYVVTPPVRTAKHKDDNEKASHEMECSAENAVGKTSLSSVKNGSQPSSCGPYTGNQTPVPAAVDTNMAPWCFHHSLGHQWLVPVMSPSEGLVFKPYTAPGFMGSACGGCGPFGLTPLTGNFVNPTYGVPASHHPHQGAMPIPSVPPIGNGYFPPYGMPIMSPAMSGSAVEQMNYFVGSSSHGQFSHLSGGGANFNVQHQGSCNMPTQKNGSILQAAKFQASKDTELQGSTASSPRERAQGVGTARAAETKNVASAPGAKGAPQPQVTNQPRRVIKVVPHNRRSASESAARIFRSIQEERKQNDSI